MLKIECCCSAVRRCCSNTDGAVEAAAPFDGSVDHVDGCRCCKLFPMVAHQQLLSAGGYHTEPEL